MLLISSVIVICLRLSSSPRVSPPCSDPSPAFWPPGRREAAVQLGTLVCGPLLGEDNLTWDAAGDGAAPGAGLAGRRGSSSLGVLVCFQLTHPAREDRPAVERAGPWLSVGPERRGPTASFFSSLYSALIAPQAQG